MGGRYRSISRSYSPPPSPRRESRSPPRRRKRYDDPRDRYPGPSAGGGGRGFRDRRLDGRSGLLVRNISLDARFVTLILSFFQYFSSRTNVFRFLYLLSKLFFSVDVMMSINYAGQKTSGFPLKDLVQLRMSTSPRITTQGKNCFFFSFSI